MNVKTNFCRRSHFNHVAVALSLMVLNAAPADASDNKAEHKDGKVYSPYVGESCPQYVYFCYEFATDESEIFKRDGAMNNIRMPDIGFRLTMSKQ